MKRVNKTVNSINEGKELVSLAFNKGHFLKFNEYLAKRFDVDTSIMVSLMVDRENFFVTKMSNYLEKFEGYFNYPTEMIDKRIGMSKYRQRRTMDILEKEGILEVKRLQKKDIHERLYKINHKALGQLIMCGITDKLKEQEQEGRMFKEREKEISDIIDLFNL